MSLKLNKIRRYTGHEGAVYVCRQQGNGKILSSGGDGWIVRWNTGEEEHGTMVAKVPAVVFSLDYHELFGVILAGDIQGGLHWIYPGNAHQNRDIAHHYQGVYAIKSWKQYFFTGGGKGLLSCWNAESGELVQSVRISSTRIRTISVHPVEPFCFIGTSDGSIVQMTIPDLELIRTLETAHENTVFCCLVHPSGKILYSGGRDARLRTWDIDDDLQPVENIPAHWYTVNDLCIDPDGRWLISASRDKTIKIWQPDSLKLLHVIDADREEAHVNSVNTLLWLPGEDRAFVSGSDDRSLVLWKLEELEDR